MPTYQKREMFRGDSLSFDLALTNAQNGSPLNLTDAKIWFTAKNNYVDPDNQAAIALDNAALGGITVTDVARGLARVDIAPIKTRSFPDGPVRVVYDVQVKDAAGFVTTVESGTLTVYPDVSRAIV